MCGICGIYNLNGMPANKELLLGMMNIMNHRGPDGHGHFIQNEIGLGHRRLSIIDIDGGAQPIGNEDGSLQIVFNGEIYNFIELREVLKKKGHIFKTRSDTEVIIHAYEEWGTECVESFNGMFAFAIWNSRDKSLFIARDHLGVKPVYYTRNKDRIVFASEIKSILVDKNFDKEIDISSLGQLFTFRYVPSPNTIFQNIYKLPPAHWMLCSPDKIIIKKFWNWKPRINFDKKESDFIEEYRFLLKDAIKLQLRSDVPVGLFLSSGIDSSVILALMRQHNNGQIYTFTIGFEDGEKTNETDDAKDISRMYNTEHDEMIIGPNDYLNYYQKYLWDTEEPLGNETAAAFYFVSKLASKRVKVVLTGQGADEPWAGYHRHIAAKLSNIYCKFPRIVTSNFKNLALLLPRNEKLKRAVQSLDEPDLLTRFAKIYSFFSPDMKDQLFQHWLSEELKKNGNPNYALKHLQSDVSDLDPLSQMLYIDTRADLPDDLLMVNDKTSMANSIEARVPFLDYRLIEFIETIPSNLKIKGLSRKYLHKRALEEWLPKKIIYRKKKGFENPVDEWLQNRMKNYVHDFLLQKNSASNRYFNADYIKKLLQLHSERKENYKRHIYLLISFELWHRQFLN